MKKYLDLADMLKPMLVGFEGFACLVLNEEEKLLSVNVWTDVAAVKRRSIPVVSQWPFRRFSNR